MKEKVVLAYSGGVDTSVAVRWMAENYDMDVIAFTVDIGGVSDLDSIKQKALKVGAVKAITLDAKKKFIESYVFPALQANAIYEGQYPLATALGRPLIAKLMVDVADKEGATAVAHGSTVGDSPGTFPDSTLKNSTSGQIQRIRERRSSAAEVILKPGYKVGKAFIGACGLLHTLTECLQCFVGRCTG